MITTTTTTAAAAATTTTTNNNNNNNNNSVSELYRPRDRLFSAKLVPTFVDRGCHVVSATDPYGHILGFLDRSCYFFLPSSSSVVLMRLSGPHSRPITSQKIW
jgi:hypothetical protein